MATDNFVVVGAISGLHGVIGGLKIRSYCDPIERIATYQPWSVQLASGLVECKHGRVQRIGKALVTTFEGVSSRDAAAGFVGCEIRIARAQLPALNPGQFYWSDVIGMAVYTDAGVALGTVKDIFATGASNDVLVVGGERERLIPLIIDTYVEPIDVSSGRLTVHWDPEF